MARRSRAGQPNGSGAKPFRQAHGRSAEGGRLTASEVPPVDELRPASPAQTARAERSKDGRFAKGNGVARMRRTRVGPSALAGFEVHPKFQAFRAWGRRYASHRIGELAKLHGGEVSAAVGSLVESAALNLAASRFLHAIAASQPSAAKVFLLASRLADSARGHERDAWQLASLEAAARLSTTAMLMPWELPPATPTQASTPTQPTPAIPATDNADEDT